MSVEYTRPCFRRLSRALPVALACTIGFAGTATASVETPDTPTAEVTAAPAAPATSDLGPFSSTEDLVTQMYKDLLFREPREAETKVASAAIDGGQDPADWIASLIASSEMDANVRSVVRLYRAYFLRNPDRQGLAHWVAMRQAGWPLGQVSHEFAKSHEFALRYGTTTDGEFIDLIYRNVMRRDPDSGGRAYWIGRLAAGLYRGSLMTRFSETPEYMRRSAGVTAILPLYNGFYQTSIPRGLSDSYGPSIDSGRKTVADYARSFLDDPKYHARFN